ncbi:thioesterase family protein [Bacillus dakarensis]|uniref:thioesterase family protein n=1 Tax=Robertmurraya dakarensis TaxID=1926278 RepID=UPI000981D07C|nr:thioesterase family protein [Bacillus dakarensis]
MELLYEDYVKEKYLDHNQHMNVTAYYLVFNKASGKFTGSIGFDDAGREENQLTIFTLETHISYFKEITEGKDFKIFGRILQYDEKRIHFYEEMRNADGDLLATCESMFLAVSQITRKAGRFPEKIQNALKEAYDKTKNDPWPENAGRKIGIPRKQLKK